MTKYRELAACKSADEFSVGDLVNVYSSIIYKNVEVDYVSGEYIGVIGKSNYYHWKQCYKLVPVKAREWDTTVVYGYSDTNKFTFVCRGEPPKRIREILE